MGVYELQEELVNEFPLYKKADETHYVYRHKSGKWAVAEERAHVNADLSWIMTSGGWYGYGERTWVPDKETSIMDENENAEEKA